MHYSYGALRYAPTRRSVLVAAASSADTIVVRWRIFITADPMPVPISPSDPLHAQVCLIDALTMSLHIRDPSTRHHCDRVGRMVQRLARYCDLDVEESRLVTLAAYFHDIGKIGVPDSVLLNPGLLDADERAIIRQHPVHGEQIFLATGRSDAKPVARLIRAHHEAFDGRGYPDHLRGEDIPLGARLLTVVDTFDAMTSLRPYRSAMSTAEAMRTLDEQSGGLVDPYVLRAFQTMHKREPLLQ